MNRKNDVQDFLLHMNFFRKDEMDTFFSLHQEKFIFNKLANFTSVKALKIFISTSVLMSAVITALIFSSDNFDTIAKIICSILFSSFASIFNMVFIFHKLHERFKLMKDESFDQLNILKNKFFYNMSARQAIFQYIPNAFAFYGEDRLNKIMKDCEIGAMTTTDLYFILHCVDNENNFGFFFTVKNYLIKIKNFKFNGFSYSKLIK